MRPRGHIATVVTLALLVLPGVRGEATEAALGVDLYPGSQSVPQLRQRLEALQTSRWLAMEVFHVDAPLGEVIKHFRRQRAAAAPSTVEPTGRLKDWLERNPEEKDHYREFREAQAGAQAGAGEPWEILPMAAAEIPTSLGGGATLSPAIAKRPVEMSYGKILLADAVVSVQLLSPHPAGDGRSLAAGTLVALIREARSNAGPTVAADETVAGPETTGLRERLAGWVVMDYPVGGIQTLVLPAGSPSTVRPPERASGVVHALAGPDEDGRIVYIENHASESRHALKTIRLSGGDEQQVFSRKGDAFLERAIGTSMALSRRGGRVALVGPLSRYATNRPSYPLRTGPLELWDLETKSGRETGVTALDRRVAWFPDGTRLAYVAMIPRAELDVPSTDAEDRFGSGFSGWDAVPVVHVFDTAQEKSRRLHVGWDPVISEDGRRVLVRDSDGRLRSVDVATGRSEAVRLPGEAGGVLALSADGVALYWALPTEGSPPEYTRVWSSMVGPRPMKTLKVAELATGRFETVVSSIDPRRDLTFGAAR